MDLLAQKRVLSFFIAAGLIGMPKTAWPSMYNLTQLDFFSMKVGRAQAVLPSDIWAEPVIAPDGRVTMYRPPQVVADLLADPTEARGRAYLQWQKEKLERIDRAAQVVGKIVRDDAALQKKAAP
ncbi:MAG: hypothetical protein HQL19_06100 [Candidatus Omnitrophica bacterium]|nr:hypothetical protein [Candidatus Omnitrophota bacterium]